MRKLLGRVTRISILLPSSFAALLCVVVFLVGATRLQSLEQSRVLTEISNRDTAVRAAAAALGAAAESINTRLLGVLADVYSPAGSAAAVEKGFGDATAAWTQIGALLDNSEDKTQVAPLAQQFDGLEKIRPKVIDALKSAKKAQVAKVYDDWIEIAVPFRRNLQRIVLALDKSGVDKVAGVLATSELGALVALVLGAVGGLIGLLAGAYVLLGVTRPMRRIETIIGDLASGRFDSEIKASQRHDEIGMMTQALRSFQTTLAESARLRADRAMQVQKAETDRRALLSNLTRDLETTVHAVAETLGTAAMSIEKSAVTTQQLVEHTADQARVAASGSVEATTSVQAAAAASEQLNASIERIGVRVGQSRDIAARAVGESAKADETIAALQGATDQIGAVVDLIRAVAGQTNLLALNATIEAARAGEAGRGFAVVASEVKQLAGQTAKATEEIAVQITTLQHTARNVLQAISIITGTIHELNGISDEIISAVQEQQSATLEIVRGVGSASSEAGQITESVHNVTEAAGRTGIEAASLKAAASELNQQSCVLRAEIERFIREARAA